MPRPSARPGMTLVELLLAMMLFGVVLVTAVGVLQQESAVFARGNDQLTALQNYRYALEALEQDLRQAGAGVLADQPTLIYAGEQVVAFNADYASRTPGDISAVFFDPDAPDGSTTALTPTRQVTLPTTAFAYPGATFTAGGVNSPAETIVFFFTPDTATARADDYGLYRQVNDLAPELVANQLVALDDRPFFQYQELVTSDTAPDAMETVSPADLPLRHSAPVHLSVEDTGSVGRIDWLRSVRVNAGAWNGLSGDREQIQPVSRLIWLRNVREQTVESCGSPPLAVRSASASDAVNGSGEPVVRLTWNPSPDDGAGESDVVRYLIWRRLAGGGVWGDPYLSIPSGHSSYQYEDAAVTPGQVYQYAISAQDCTPTQSEQSTPTTVAVPAS